MIILKDIDWIVTEEEILEKIGVLSINEIVQLITLPLDIPCNELKQFILNEFKINPKALRKLCQLPEEVEVPKEVSNIYHTDDNDLSILTNWLSDTYGYFFYSYIISSN